MPQHYAQGNIVKRGDQTQAKAAGAETVSTTGPTIYTSDGAGTVYFEVNVTAVSGTGPTMNIVVEGSNDFTNWFTLGTIGANGFSTSPLGTAPTNFTTAAGPVRAAFTPMQFVRYRSVIGGTSPSFNYTVLTEVI
jgi:hypothetical protein